MPTIQQHFKKSIKYIFLFFLSIACLFSICFFIAWLLPSQAYNWFVISTLTYAKEIIFVFLIIFLFFVFFRAYVSLKKTKRSKQQDLIRILSVGTFWIFVSFFCFLFLFNSGNDYDCDRYNHDQKLNGGFKEISGNKYIIRICGSGLSESGLFSESMEPVQLSVFNESGSVLVRRNYKVFWGGKPGHEPLKIDGEKIIYQDDETQQEHIVNVPPSMLDWVWARVFF
jgi:hypothetical protein